MTRIASSVKTPVTRPGSDGIVSHCDIIHTTLAMPLARLVFFPQHASDQPADSDAIIKALTEIGFISTEPHNNAAQQTIYLPGIEFLNLLTFLGCSPHIHLHPDDGDNFCYLSMTPVLPAAASIGYTATVKPRCPRCKNKIADWKNIPGCQQADSLYTCTQCGAQTSMDKLNWRHEGGYARFSLQLAHIHPHEAVPSEKLLMTLRACSGFDWSYCYASD